jgi:uncharacterized membrane protein
MTRTDVMASSRPKAIGAVSMRMGSSGASRRFLAIPVALLLAAALGAPTAMAATTSETGYAQKPAEPKTTTTTTTTPTTTTPKSGTSPAKEVSPSKAATTPEKTTTTTSTTKTEATKSLPFTGLDLRWIVAVGILMMGAGFSIVTVQRRQRRSNSGR